MSTMAARVLLADDTPDIRALLRLVLSRQDDFEVVAEAGDGSEAIELARTHHPDVVLLDLAMPVMDGLEAIPGVRAAAPDCKIVVLSGFSADRMSDEALRAGADAYIEKGTSPLKLVSELRRICGFRETTSHHPIAVSAGSTGDDRTRPWGPDEMSVVSHELFGPLAVIEGFASLLERPEIFEPGQIREHAAAIGRSARHLRALLQAVTDARRLEGEGIAIDRAATDVAALVRDLVQDLAVVTDGHTVRVEAPEALVASVDPLRARQIVTNLVTNAAKFSPPGTLITVGVWSDDDRVEVTVHDDGPGVPAHRQAELFRRFGRLDPGIKGMGLGLYVSRGLARAHGGDVTLLDDGRPGATFVLRLPR